MSKPNSTENLLRKIPFGNSKYRALNEYIKNLSSNTSEISSKGIENMRPNNGFDAIAYFSVCREIGVYEFMYFIRKNLESRNTSPYDLEPILRPKNDEPHYIFSTFGILVAAGTEQEHLSLTQWFSEAVLYEALIKILTFRYLPAWKSFFTPLNMVQFCAQINRNVRYNTILMSHITNCICIALKFARHALAKLIRYKEDELNWNSKEINQTTSMTETWKKGLIVKNDLEHLRKQLNSFPNVLHCIRYRLASSLLHKFQSSIQNYIYDELNLSSMEQRDIERENVKEDITEKNFRLVIYPILLKQSEEESQLLLWPLPSTIITIFNLTFEQFKESLHLNKTISEHELTQIYFNEEKEIENISEIIDNPIDVNSIIEAFYNNSSSVDLNDSKHSMNIPWNIINPIGLEATNMNFRDMVHCYLPTYGDFEKGLIPEHQPHQNQSILSRMDLDQSHLNISGYNCFPTIENASQMGLHSLIEQQCEAMKLYDCLITSWNKRIYEKTNNTIQSLQWIIKMNETINELSVLLKNEDLHTELHKHQRLFELSFQWINNVVHHIKYESLLNNHEDNRLNCFIIIDYNPLFNLLYHEIIEKLSKLFSIFITIVDNSLISISNQLDDFIQIHANIPSDFNGFIQIVTYLNRVHNDYEKLFKDHDNLCRQVEFLQHIQKCSNNYTELKFIQFIQWSNYEQFLIKWKKFINQIEWARKKFQRYQDEFYQVYNQKVEETIKEVERLVHLLTTGKYSDVNNDAQMILNDMKEPYCYVIKLESFIHQLVNQYQIVEKCKQNEKQFQKGKIEKLNVSPSNKSFIKTTITSYDNTIHITKDCQGNYKLKYFNETNNVLLHIDNEIKKINCRYDAWQLNLKIVTFKQELYKSNLGEDTSGRNSSRNDHCTIEIPYHPWIFLNIGNLIEKLYELSNKLQSLQDSELLNRIKQNETMENDSYSIKKLNQTINGLCNIKLIQNYWLYLYRLNLLKQNNEEGNDSQFTILTNNYVHLVNDPLLNDQVISIQSIEWDNNEFIQLNYINLQLFIEIMNCKWNLWLTLKDDLYENVSMFEKSIDEMCETFPLFCLLSKMEMIELLSNWSIPYCDYAAPLKCSVDDFIDPKQNSYQSYLNTNLTNCGLVNLNKWIKRLFPYLLDCVMVWCKAEKCWKITGVINEFHQHIELLHSLRWIPSISQWFKQFNSTLQLTFLKMTLNSLLEIENNHQWINELIREKQLVPVIILELTIRIASWQQLEKVIIKEDRENEFIEIIISRNTQMKNPVKVTNLRKETNLDKNNFIWQRLIKTQLISPIFNSEINDSFSNESNEYNDIPTIGIKQFSKIHLYKWDNQSLLMNNNTLYIPLLNTSQELIQLGSALNNHEFGLLIGSFGTGKQTIIRQLAFLLGRRLIEFSSNIFNDTFENKLKNDILSCTRIGGLFSIMNMHFEDFIKNLQQSIENIDRNSHKLITYHCNQYISDSQQCLFNQNVRIDYSFGLFGTYDSRKFQNLSKVQKLSFRNVTIGPPNYSFIIQCLFKYYLPEYQSHSIIPRLVNLLNRSLTHFTNESDPNYKQMNNYYLSFSMIIKSFELAKQFWLEKLNHIQEIRQRTALKSSMILRKEEDKLAEAAIIYGLTKVYRINLSIHSIQDNPIKILFQSSSDFNGLATIEQCLSINSVLPLMYNNEEFLECDNIPNEENNNNQEITIDSLNLKQNIKIFNIPDSLNSYLNKFNLISTNSRSKQFDIYNKIISLKHFFPYSNEHLTSYFINDHNMTELDVDISSIFEEWLLLDLSDQSIEHLTFLNDDNILNLLKVVKNLKFTRKLFIEKTTINDLSPGFIHQFSILSTEVINNNELNWLHLWRIWCKQSYLSYMVINSIWDKILNELDHYIPLVLDQTWEFINQWCHKDEDDTSGLINIKSYKNIFCQQSIKNSLALMSELLNKYFPRELWELRKNAIKPSSVYQSNLTLIDYYWSEWRNIEDQPVFYETLIRNLFLFSFIWGIGGGLAGDPRLKSRFETIILRILKDFIRLPNSLNIDSIDNASSSTLSIESYYANQIHSISSSIEWNNNNNNSNHEQQCEDMKELQYSLFNCLVDLRTGYFTPFWYTDCLQLHWPEEYDIINPKENNYHTKSFLPTLFHLTVHLFTGSLFIQSGRPVIISGPFGSGKSQLAIAISRDSEQSKQLIDSYNNKKKKRTSLVRIQSTDFLHRIISNSQKTSSQYQKHTSDEKINLMHNIIILEDVHLISKTAANNGMYLKVTTIRITH
ncbi:putative normocyte-binding protein 1 [Schistosoma mansoni]|uniref:putative normocyte-binding protein 1 n=1 Tax=Schistosoma mansoni TaxID=6183 RepID=UPI0001A64102|nr:putative normocyte-binding protein 1 [Schistosoma mansoni]|eukprot:XP_018647648.1 putative normocyte-binding protein 1 [Schistosoma mansoni]